MEGYKGNGVNLVYKEIDTIVGKLRLVASKEALVAILWEKERLNRVKLPNMTEDTDSSLFQSVEAQLHEYFRGLRTSFNFPIEFVGTLFQIEVWNALKEIPYGKTVSYGEIANKIARPKAVRAVGAAIGRNPLSIVVPCHRVIGNKGHLTGFAGGLDIKHQLLTLEKKA
ncbi:MAG: Methylated-DNA--protein-cysteine methyltransferase [Chlamydiales bacterium]|nr:Methylated-DNA--protein-cysteine methyltransferase [Chlamydiales bacterium]